MNFARSSISLSLNYKKFTPSGHGTHHQDMGLTIRTWDSPSGIRTWDSPSGHGTHHQDMGLEICVFYFTENVKSLHQQNLYSSKLEATFKKEKN